MWALYNSIKGWALYSLSEREVQLILNTLTVNELRLVKVCQKNDKSWQALTRDQFPQLFGPMGQMEQGYPQLHADIATESTDTDYFVVKTKKVLHPRLHTRIEKKIKATILGQNQNFETMTIDLSEGGIQFMDIIPEWVSGYFIVQLKDQNQSTQAVYSLMCALVEDQKEKKRVQVMSEESDPQFILYKQWLEGFLK